MAKYLDLDGLTSYDAKIKNYVDGKGSVWEQIYSGTMVAGTHQLPGQLGITNSSYGASYKIVSDTNIYIAVPESNGDSNLTATKYTLDDGTSTAITNIITYNGYKYSNIYLNGETYVDYSKTWEDVLQAYSWAYDGAPLRKNFYAGKVRASTNTAVFLFRDAANIKVYKLKTE
jgi:hypothetical protein